MKQVGQTLATGEVDILDVPIPGLRDSFVLVRNHCSVISAGTEKSKIDMGRKSLLEKARARPDLVAQVLKKVKNEGLSKTVRTVRTRLNAPSPLGYSCAGTVTALGGQAVGLEVGQRVACGGADYANHAEYVAVPKNLVVPVPDNVTDEEAAFATVGSIALQGVRLLSPSIGEKILVVGLGLLGQIAVQLLRANGCTVIASDLDPILVDLAEKFGAVGVRSGTNIVQECRNLTNGVGVDGVIICAGSAANSIIEMCGDVCREKGRVVVVGAVRMDIPREAFFKKEISIVISRSYGPGRYDPVYEENGVDYPIGYVRFTEQRNMATILDLISEQRLDVRSLITHRFSVEDAKSAYSLLEGSKSEPYIGIVLNYNQVDRLVEGPYSYCKNDVRALGSDVIGLSFLGAGNYATSTLLPIVKEMSEVSLVSLATSSGLSASGVCEQFGFRRAVDGLDSIVDDESSAVVITTRHDSHAAGVVAALRSGKHVYVEKPLALTVSELCEIREVLCSSISETLMVGFNRRFSPAVVEANRYLFGSHGPCVISIRVNAGAIDRSHWVHDIVQGGGRVIGEACHFIDLAAAISGSMVSEVFSHSMRDGSCSLATTDNIVINLRFTNGSVASIVYTAVGAGQLPKEYIEVHQSGRSVVIDDFRRLVTYGSSGSKIHRFGGQDKGQRSMIKSWIEGLRVGSSLIDPESLLNSSLASVLAVESLLVGMPLSVDFDSVGL